MAQGFVIIGGGPAGHTAATGAARLGAQVTLVERDIVESLVHPSLAEALSEAAD